MNVSKSGAVGLSVTLWPSITFAIMRDGPIYRRIVRVLRERRIPDKTETDPTYYISSLPAEAESLLMATRFHWTVENSFHWVLDEDDAHVRVGHAAHNIAVVRQMALNILKKDTSKGNIRTKRFKAGPDITFLESCSTKFDAIALQKSCTELDVNSYGWYNFNR